MNSQWMNEQPMGMKINTGSFLQVLFQTEGHSEKTFYAAVTQAWTSCYKLVKPLEHGLINFPKNIHSYQDLSRIFI